MKILPKIFAQTSEERLAREYRSLIQEEAKIGGALFGPLRAGGRREFFCLDPHTWVWHEEWIDQYGDRQILTTRYDVRSNGVFKTQNGESYQPISRNEAKHLYKAVDLYEKRVNNCYAERLQAA